MTLDPDDVREALRVLVDDPTTDEVMRLVSHGVPVQEAVQRVLIPKKPLDASEAIAAPSDSTRKAGGER